MLQVAQQVMSLFEGALSVEKQLEALELEEQLEQNEETQRAAGLNSPSKTNGHDISISVKQVTVQNRFLQFQHTREKKSIRKLYRMDFFTRKD